MAQTTVKLTLHKLTEEENVYIPTMNGGNYAIATVDVHDTSGVRFTPHNHNLTTIEMLNAILNDTDIRNAGYEIASFDQLVYFWLHLGVNKRVTDSLRPDKGKSYRGLTTSTAIVGNEDGYKSGTADIRTIDERLKLIGLKEGKPQAQVAYANGIVDEISTHTQWKAVKGQQTEKISILLSEHNFPGKWLVDADFGSDGVVGADAGGFPLDWGSDWGVRLLKELE